MQLHTYDIAKKYAKPVAYFSMEFAIDQALKIYSGGLGFLAGSHMRSAYDLKQNVVGIGMLWSYGYYDQSRNEDRTLKPTFTRKYYYFLQELEQKIYVEINGQKVLVKAYYLDPEIFGTAPMIFLSTDTDENDYLSRTISHKLYDSNERTRIAQEIVLGIGGVKILEAIAHHVDIYHMNEGHALPLIFALRGQFPSFDAIKEHVVFTTHTPEAAGNEVHNFQLLLQMGFFAQVSESEIRSTLHLEHNDDFSLTVSALRGCKVANGVSKIHADVANDMWKAYANIAPILAITNAQNRRFWTDKTLLRALDEHEDFELMARKKHLKQILFKEVADQTGKMFNPDILTVVWARRFAEYKRPALLKYDFDRFEALMQNTTYPIQIIFAGKPYPEDVNAMHIFNDLVQTSHRYKNMAVLIGYEIELSRKLKQGSDIWLNTPRITREASGTSGMTASMNASIHFSINDGWHPEFCRDGKNSFTIVGSNADAPIHEQDFSDHANMMARLEDEILPLYYDHPKKWTKIMKNAITDVETEFDSGRMAHEYYKLMYNA